jgi:GPI ethanolamine phosphate transferase 1
MLFSELKQAHMLFYKPFVQLERMDRSGIATRMGRLTEIEQLIHRKEWDDARLRSAELISVSLEGLRYLQT